MNEETARKPYNRRQKGTAAEDAAVTYLRSAGYTILERNWRCRSGEIDIVARLEGSLVFVEVRSRSEMLQKQGTPEESVTGRKIHQVRSTAEVYLYGKGQSEQNVSFDVISVLLREDLSIASMRHIRGAF